MGGISSFGFSGTNCHVLCAQSAAKADKSFGFFFLKKLVGDDSIAFQLLGKLIRYGNASCVSEICVPMKSRFIIPFGNVVKVLLDEQLEAEDCEEVGVIQGFVIGVTFSREGFWKHIAPEDRIIPHSPKAGPARMVSDILSSALEEFGLVNVDMNASFVELGIDSILGLQIVHYMNEHLNSSADPGEALKLSNLRSLIYFMEENAQGLFNPERFEILKVSRSFNGNVYHCQHFSRFNLCEMKFSLFVPLGLEHVHILYFLGGIGSNELSLFEKTCALKSLSDLQIACIVPDTSTRVDSSNDHLGYVGEGAGFFMNANTEKWAKHYQNYSYVVQELEEVLTANFPHVTFNKKFISGFSMGGFGALNIGLRNADRFSSISCFAPFVSPLETKVQFVEFLGSIERGSEYDPCYLAESFAGRRIRILVDQGLLDERLDLEFRRGQKLNGMRDIHPQLFKSSCDKNELIDLELNYIEGFDHSYYFVSTFFDNHLRFHLKSIN